MPIVFFILALLFLIGFAIAGPMGAPWVPMYKRDVEKILDDCKLRKGYLCVELGCGDGRLIAAAAKRGVKAIGYEINPVLWLIASVRNLSNRRSSIRLGNFWASDLSKADVVMTFLVPRFMSRLEKKLEAELKPGARLASYIYKLPNKRPVVKRHHWRIYEF